MTETKMLLEMFARLESLKCEVLSVVAVKLS